MFDCACFRSETGNKQKNAAQNNTMQQPVCTTRPERLMPLAHLSKAPSADSPADDLAVGQEECGCGIVFGTDPSGSLVCRSFVPGGPAESSGLVQVIVVKLLSLLLSLWS